MAAGREMAGISPDEPLSDLSIDAFHTEDDLKMMTEIAIPEALEKGRRGHSRGGRGTWGLQLSTS